MVIEQIPIRARITAPGFSVETPYILSFNVNKQRGTFSTFSASIKIKGNDVDKLAGKVEIYAGKKGSLNKIFTGYIKKRRPSPCWDDPAYIILNIDGADVLSKLASKKFNRRQIVSDTTWCIIDNVSPGLRSGTLKYTKDPVLISSPGEVNTNNGTLPTGNDDTSAIRNDKVLGEVKKGASKLNVNHIIQITSE